MNGLFNSHDVAAMPDTRRRIADAEAAYEEALDLHGPESAEAMVAWRHWSEVRHRLANRAEETEPDDHPQAA